MHTMQPCILNRLWSHMLHPSQYLHHHRYEIMLLCWNDDPDERPHFEVLSNMLMSILPDTTDDMLSSSVGNSYVDMSSSVFCSSENPDSDASMAQTIFTNHSSSLSDYRGNGREKYRQREVYSTLSHVHTYSKTINTRHRNWNRGASCRGPIF